MNFAIRSLLRLRDGQWVNAASARLRNVGDSRAAPGTRRGTGPGRVFDGWDLIASAIAEGDPGHREVALRQVGCFQQMKDASGKSVNLNRKARSVKDRRTAAGS